MYGHRAVAAVNGREVLYIVAALVIGLSVPDVGPTGCYVGFNMRTLVDGQMQHDGTVAAVDGLEVLHIVAALEVGLAVPGVAVASGFGELLSNSVVDG